MIAPTRELVADVAAVFAMIDGRANVGVSGVRGARSREEDFGIAVTGGGVGDALINTPGACLRRVKFLAGIPVVGHD